jgi:hypothetical protein
MRKVLVVGARAFAGLAPRSARVGGPADQASCVAQFVNAFPPGAVGPFASRMAQNPALHPFGENAVSVQATSPRDACPFAPPG